MVERGPFPLRGGMADGAVLRKACSRMVGIGSGLEGGTMAANALRACSAEGIARVALQTRHARVGSGKCETRPAMIELRTSPLSSRMTDRAILRKTRGCMIWVGGVLKGWTMTGNARRTGSSENSTHVALGTVDTDMGSRQRKAGLIVFELGATPLLSGVTSLAIG